VDSKEAILAVLGRCRYDVQNLEIWAKIGAPFDIGSGDLVNAIDDMARVDGKS
jgi:hypothetical protein